MNIALFLSRKLSLRQANRTTSPGVIIAVTGIALSLIIMMLSIAVVTGFKNEITAKLLGFNAPVTISSVNYSYADTPQESTITISDSLREIITEVATDSRPALALTLPAIFKTDSAFQGVALKGLSDDTQWAFAQENIIEGNIPDAANPSGIVISSITADALGLRLNDRILTHFLASNNVKTRKYTICGIYNSHFSDFDRSVAFIGISPLQQLLHLDSLQGSSIELLDIPFNHISATAENLYNRLLSNAIENHSSQLYQVTTVFHQASSFFGWLDLLDTNVWVILILMACVSAFTLISSLFIIMLQRVTTIGLLKALGASDRLIRNTFIFMALKIVMKGLIIGNLTGICLMILQSYLHIIPLDASAYYLNYVPININWISILYLNIATILISWLILILPSHFIGRISPATVIRYE